MTEEQYKQSMLIITYLWTIGVIKYESAAEVITQIQNYRAIAIMKEVREARLKKEMEGK